MTERVATASKRETATPSGEAQPRRRGAVPTGLGGDVLALQRAAGNQAVNGLVQPDPRPNGNGASGAPAGALIQRQPVAGAGVCPTCGRRGKGRCPGCGQPLVPVQRSADGSPRTERPELARVRRLLDTQRGEPLEPETRHAMETSFGRDFGDVRIHTGAEAAQSARDIGARAYTAGDHVVFGANGYRPESPEGARLLAHELTHVAQGRGAPSAAADLQVAPADSAAEREAASAARQAVRGGPVAVSHTVAPPTISRDGEAEDDDGGGVLDCLWGIVAGEFIENPGLCQIIVETLVGLIPYVDQAMDIRDLIAHIYYMAFRNQVGSVMRWIGLVFTLIGAIPEVGTVIKGISKAFRRYAGAIAEGTGLLIRRLQPTLAEFGINLARHADEIITKLNRLLREKWGVVTRKARTAWDELLNWFQRQLDRVPSAIISLSTSLRRFRDGINDIRRATGEMIGNAFGRARDAFNDFLEGIRRRFGRRTDDAGDAGRRGRGGGDGDGGPPRNRNVVTHRGVVVDITEMQGMARRFRDAIPEASRGRKTVAVGLVRDPEGVEFYVWSANRNWTHPNIRAVATESGVMRLDPTPGSLRARGRGDVGAPEDAEQVLLEGAAQNSLEVIAIAPTRPACPDCVLAARAEDVLLVDPP